MNIEAYMSNTGCQFENFGLAIALKIDFWFRIHKNRFGKKCRGSMRYLNLNAFVHCVQKKIFVMKHFEKLNHVLSPEIPD